jgi:hypothetical protein
MASAVTPGAGPVAEGAAVVDDGVVPAAFPELDPEVHPTKKSVPAIPTQARFRSRTCVPLAFARLFEPLTRYDA